MDTRQLSKIGLTGHKARVFLALLELGRATTIELAQKTELKRTTVYDIVLDLINTNYVSETRHGKRRLFIAQDPQIILNNFEQRLAEMKDLVPDLMSVYGRAVPKPITRFYDGLTGVKNIMEDILNMRGKEVLSWSTTEDLIGLFGHHYVKHWLNRRVRRGIWSTVLHPYEGDRAPDHFIRDDQKLLRRSKKLPRGFRFNGVLCIYDHRVAYVSSRDDSFGFIVESRAFAQMMQMIFQSAWSIAK